MSNAGSGTIGAKKEAQDNERVSLGSKRVIWERVFYAFALSGPYCSYERYGQLVLAQTTTLALLRALLTAHTELQGALPNSTFAEALADTSLNLHQSLIQDDNAEIASSFAKARVGGSPYGRGEYFAALKNRDFFGIGDTLGLLLASLSDEIDYNTISAEEFGEIARTSSWNLLAGHYHREEFLKGMEEAESRGLPITSPDNSKLLLLKYFSKRKYWSFWREWYQGFLDGNPMDRELQRRVALIEDPIWESGPGAVAKEIERIRAEYLLEKVPLAEKVEFNPKTAKFFVTPIEVEKPDLLGATLAQVEDALEDVLASASNGLHDNAREVRALRRVFTKYGNNPQQIEMGFVGVHKGLVRQILNDELPPSEENLALQDALEEGARAIRATHPDVAENRKILTEQAIRELPEGAKEQLEEALPILVEISEFELAEEWQHDIPQLINDATLPLPSGAPPLPGADETTRIFSRAAKIALHLKIKDVVNRITESTTVKAGALILLIEQLVKLGLSLF
ncbi:hypothetical protein ROA7450_00793 [Roseovarius albus]|uniref:Uncharacterized protein n=1 Tax=Roseovarius albus TaxID=1247867 RepID=A0A1X6YIC5_9RHOB|nr:hypothetical protein [Roseovarius albus]SLN21761.1 hypothetical protein ROA7450_00793 [Roseovarius albus]